MRLAVEIYDKRCDDPDDALDALIADVESILTPACLQPLANDLQLAGLAARFSDDLEQPAASAEITCIVTYFTAVGNPAETL